MDINCKIKDSHATIHRPREARKQGGFMVVGHSDLPGKWNKRDFLSKLRTGWDGNMSDQLGGVELWERVLKQTTGKGCIWGQIRIWCKRISQESTRKTPN